MKLWRLTRRPFVALDGAGAQMHGGRYSPPGVPVVPLASEAGLAVLIAMRYLPDNPDDWPQDYVLGWTQVDHVPERVPDPDEATIHAFVSEWLTQRRSLLAAIPSRVLPEADVILLNPAHPAAGNIAPLDCRPFDFAQCLHKPPMLAQYKESHT